jgi:hypothetical protein
MARSTRLAVAFSRETAGRKTVVKPTWNGTTTRATRSGTASARFFGSSSPRIMLIRVATSTDRTAAIGSTAGRASPTAVSGGSRNPETAGSSVYPASSVVMVMPSWALDRCVEVMRRAPITVPRPA